MYIDNKTILSVYNHLLLISSIGQSVNKFIDRPSIIHEKKEYAKVIPLLECITWNHEIIQNYPFKEYVILNIFKRRWLHANFQYQGKMQCILILYAIQCLLYVLCILSILIHIDFLWGFKGILGILRDWDVIWRSFFTN